MSTEFGLLCVGKDQKHTYFSLKYNLVVYDTNDEYLIFSSKEV